MTTGVQTPNERALAGAPTARSTVAISCGRRWQSGESALTSALNVGGVPSVAAAAGDHEPIGFASRSNRQHAWDD